MMGARIRVFGALGLLLIAGCSKVETVTAPTEILLRINNTDDQLRASMTALRVTLSVQQGGTWQARPPLALPSKNLKWPVDIPITPSPGAKLDRQLEVVVDALAGEKVLAQTRATVVFVENEHRLLEVYLYVCPGHTPDEGPVCAPDGCTGDACKVCSPTGTCEAVLLSPTTKLTPADASRKPQNKPPPGTDGYDGGGDSGASNRPDAGPGGMDAGGAGGSGAAGSSGGADAGPLDAMPGMDGSIDLPDADAGSDAAMSLDPCLSNHGGCDPLVMCTSNGTSVSCDPCPAGYDDTNGDGTLCTDIDECALQTFDCKTNSTCMNTAGSYDCPCDVGFHGDGHQQCLPNVLCDATGSNCAALASCMDVSGTQYCVCGSGYEGDGASCTDIDECASNNGGCGSATYYSCTNNTGAPPTCADIKECATNNGGCGNPSYITCGENVGAAPTCSDIKECATNNGGCGNPSYITCGENVGAPPTCSDIKECATNNGGCGNPSYITCGENVGAPPTCSDIKECATNNGGCGNPSYITCGENVGAPPTCSDIKECATNNGGCGNPSYITCGENVGAPPTCSDIKECATNNGGCGNPSYITCGENVGAPPTCSDIKECATNNGGCGNPAYVTCGENVGAAPTCSDINECLTNNGGCGNAANFSCVNNYGAAPTCGDVNECNASNICTSYYPCQNLAPYYECQGQFPDWKPTDSPSSFTVHGSGSSATVTDSNTGLEWQYSPPSVYSGCTGSSGGSCTWAEAKLYCSGLSLSGGGWRLPTQAELESIVDYTKLPAGGSVAISTTAFAPLMGDRFWSSSQFASSSSSDPAVWIVKFSTGASMGQSGIGNTAYVRCVR